MERRTLHITLKDRKRNTWIRAKTRVADARERATKLKWQYAEHNARQVDNRWNAQILNWRPWLGKREQGRPQMRWEDDIKRHADLTWRRRAQNRDTCKEIGETYFCKWIDEVIEEEEEDCQSERLLTRDEIYLNRSKKNSGLSVSQIHFPCVGHVFHPIWKSSFTSM